MFLWLSHVLLLTSFLATLGEAGKMSPARWLRRSVVPAKQEKRQTDINSSAPQTVTFTTNYEYPSGGPPDTCICTLAQPFTQYVTITSTYTGNSNDGVSTVTLARPSGRTPGTVEIATPVYFVTIISTYTGNSNDAVTTTTLAQPSGGTPGTIEIATPVYFVTITSTYTGNSNDGVTTTTLAQPSGNTPGTVEIATPVYFVTTTSFYVASNTDATISTISVQPTGTSPGTIEVLYPQYYATIYVASSGFSGTSTTTLADPTGTASGTIEIIVPSQTDYMTTTGIYTGTDVVLTSYTTTISTAGVSAGQIEVVNPNYAATTVTEGTTGATRVLQSATGTQSGLAQVNIPTPDLSCNNHGFEYAVFDNPYTRGLQAADPTYSSFAAAAFQTQTPLETGLTNYLGLPFVARGTTASIYGNPPESLNLKAINHRGYLFAKLSGNFTFDFPLSDDITLLWVGNNVYGPTYTRANANLEQLYNGGIPIDQQTRYTYNITLTQGQYIPLRVLYANAQYDADFQFNVYAPDGELVTNSSTAFTFSPYVVHFSCDGVSAPRYVPFGQEG